MELVTVVSLLQFWHNVWWKFCKLCEV